MIFTSKILQCILAALLILSIPAEADEADEAENVLPGPARISVISQWKAKKENNHKEKTAANIFCEKLGTKLVSGLLGFGPFNSYICQIRKSAKILEKRPGWNIGLIFTKKKLRIKIIYNFVQKKRLRSKIIQTIQYDAGTEFLTKIDGSLLNLLGREIIDHLPMAGIWYPQSKMKKLFNLDDVETSAIPQELYVYTLKWEPNLEIWIPEIVGTAKRQISRVGRGFKWGLRKKKKTTENLYWLHNRMGRGILSIDIHKQIGSHLEGSLIPTESTLSTFRSSYLAMNVIKPLSTQPLLGKGFGLGFNGEITQGLFEGTGWEIDHYPKVSVEDESYTLSLAWTKFSLTYGLEYDFGDFFTEYTSILIRPMIGMFKVKAALPKRFGNKTVGTRDIDENGTLNTGLEISLYRRMLGIDTYLWMSQDFSLLVLKEQGSTIEKVAGGLDLVLHFGAARTINSKLSLFYDQTGYRSTVDSNTRNTISSLYLSLGFGFSFHHLIDSTKKMGNF